MARSRNLKPGFFTNDILAEVEPLGRILFSGLWCHADREGRLHDRTKKLKAEILPYDNCDVEVLLDALAVRGFILRYEVNGNRYIQIANFLKHQNPHHMEVPSEIPPPPGYENRFNHSPITKEQRQRIFRRDNFTCLKCGAADNLHIDHIVPVSKGGTSEDGNLRTLCEPCNTRKGNRIDDESRSSRDRIDNGDGTHADSLNPLTDSLNPSTTEAGLQPASCPKDEIISLYHEFLPMCPSVQKWTDTRDRLLRARWREHPALDLWKQYFAIVKRSRFLTGKTNGHGDRPPFLADFEWLIKPGNFAKVMEGKYDSRQ